MPLLSSPVSTTVAALRQYWRCLMPVPASPLAYTDGWRCLLSRTTQVTEDQLHLEGGEDPLPRAVARITKLPGQPIVIPHPFRQPVQGRDGADLGGIGHGQLPLGIGPHGPLVDLCVSCSHIVRIFKIYLTGIKILKTYDTNNYTDVYFSVYLLFYLPYSSTVSGIHFRGNRMSYIRYRKQIDFIFNFQFLIIKSMALNYSVSLRTNPIKKDEPAKAYATAQINGELSLKQLSRRVSMQTTVSRADVVAVMISTVENLLDALQEGKQVDFGDLGKFRLQILNESAESLEKFTSTNITGVSIQYIPGEDLKNVFAGLEFQPVATRKAQQAVLRAEKAGETTVDISKKPAAGGGDSESPDEI